ncbi:MAG: TIGR01777 family oxidoreductase [Candidatus Melainabacteria bacterium]|nr:TIGR01777 family oxidoreductase [Candidatus Melainabacteria bacterium]
MTGGKTKLKVALTGARGLIGTALAERMVASGFEVVRVSRDKTDKKNPVWDPESGSMDDKSKEKLEGLHAFIHLAGENIASGRWTKDKKEEIQQSRVQATSNLIEALSSLQTPPANFLCASAIGYYGNRGDETLTEKSSVAKLEFLSGVCREWEKSANSIKEIFPETRVVNLRFGVVLSKKGGALNKMLPPFQMGLGGPIGNGRQYMSWIDIEDAAGAIIHCLNHTELSGPVNIVAPNAVTNAEFTKTLADVIKKPAFLPMPDFAAKMVFGQMAEELLLASTRVRPSKLEETGFRYEFPTLHNSLMHLLV